MEYHSHIYFTDSTRAIAERLREQLLERFPGRRVSRLVGHPIGPHLYPMFEIDYDESEKSEVRSFIETHRDGLSVLIHPDVMPEVEAHTTLAVWLGEKLPLDLTKLDIGTNVNQDIVFKQRPKP